MPKSPPDIYARCLWSPRGYPLWTPEPSHQLLAYRRDGLRIGDVGVVNSDGSFDVFFNICLPQDHPFHQATGVPNNFKPLELTDMDIRTVINAENPGSIIATPSVKRVRTPERYEATSSKTRTSGLEYEFNLSSSEAALLILPGGAERHDLLNRHRFSELATRHGVDWYRFAEEKIGQIISNDSLYLITGLHKSRSWSLAAFEETSESGDSPARFRITQAGRGNIATTGTWETTRSISWRVGPVDNHGTPNQSVFIRGFKVAHRFGMFRTRRISVKVDAPSIRPNPVTSSGAIQGNSWLALACFFGCLSPRRTAGSSGSGLRDEIVANRALNEARNEIQNNGALAVREHVAIQRISEASQAFHPSDIINRYLLHEDPSANIAITHDNEWINLLEENLIHPENFEQEGLLEKLVSQNYCMASQAGAVYLRSRNSALDTSNVNKVDITMEEPEVDSGSPISTAVGAISSTEQGNVTASQTPQDTGQVNTPWNNLHQIVSRSESLRDLTEHITRDGGYPIAGGGCADIYKGTLRLSQTSVKVAIKVIKVYSADENSHRVIKRLRREMKVWMQLDHPNVLSLFGTTFGFGPSPAMVCPWLDNGTLTSYLVRRNAELETHQVLALVYDIASGLQYLHSRSVVHGDLSGSNVLIDVSGRACITDFGLSMVLEEIGPTFATSSGGKWRATLRWAAPELLDLADDAVTPHTGPTIQSDIYSFGGIMLQILSGKVPYHYYSRDVQVVAALFRGETPTRPDASSVTDRRWMFIQRCWSPFRCANRPSSEEIVAFSRDDLFGRAS